MSIFANLFQGSKTTSSTLFSEANQYRTEPSAQSQPLSTAAPAIKRKKKRRKSDDDQPLVNGERPAPETHDLVSRASPSKSKAVGTALVQSAALDDAKSGERRKNGSSKTSDQAALDTHADIDSDDSTAPREKASLLESAEARNVEDEEATKRTIFVGNIPADTKKSALKKVFSKYGSIETIRLRSLPIDNESRMPRNLQIKAGKVNSSGGSANAYVRFKARDEATAACAENMSLFNDHHIRVDMAGSKSGKAVEAHYPPARSVFVGNLALDIQEEELINIFNAGDQAMQLENSVEAVRVVRDSKSRIGKGIAYVLFKTRVAALAALQLNGSECKGRKMRVSRVEKSHAKAKVGGPHGSKTVRTTAGQHKDKKSDEFLGQKHGKAGIKKKAKSLATAQSSGTGTTKKAQAGGSSRAVKRPAVAARKAKALLAAGKVPPASALAALKKKQKQKKQGRPATPKE